MEILLAPHNDDEALFAAVTLQRVRPLVVVVTDSWVQFHRGDGVTADGRWAETVQALDILGCPGLRLGIPDVDLALGRVVEGLRTLTGVSRVWAPARQGGHPHHDLVHLAAAEAWADVPQVLYGTYSAREPVYATEGEPLVGTMEERATKAAALACYRSQWGGRSKSHFQAALALPERVFPKEPQR